MHRRTNGYTPHGGPYLYLSTLLGFMHPFLESQASPSSCVSLQDGAAKAPRCTFTTARGSTSPGTTCAGS